MMATTHVLAGIALAAGAAALAPEHASVAVAAAVAGGILPDLDLYAGHRKTLHYPVYYAALALPAVRAAALVPVPVTIAAALFLLAAALHCAMDAFGGGLELKPWEGTSERAVYDHYNGRWIAPRRWIRYDGAPEDLLLAAVLSAPALALFDGRVRLFVAGLLAVSALYVVIRKPVVLLAEALVALLPQRLLAYVPERFVADFEGRAGESSIAD